MMDLITILYGEGSNSMGSAYETMLRIKEQVEEK